MAGPTPSGRIGGTGGAPGSGEYYPYYHRGSVVIMFEDFLGYIDDSVPKIYGKHLFKDNSGGDRTTPGWFLGTVNLGAAGGNTIFGQGLRHFSNGLAGYISEKEIYAQCTTYPAVGQWCMWGYFITVNDYIMIGLTNAGNFRYLMSVGGAVVNLDSGVPVDNAWHRFYIKIEFGQITFRIDGVSEQIYNTLPGVNFRQGEWQVGVIHTAAVARSVIDFLYCSQYGGVSR